MSKISNRIKKYALSNFDFHLDESLQMSNLDLKHLHHANLQEDQDIKLRQATVKPMYEEMQTLLNLRREKAIQTLHCPKNEDRQQRQSFGLSEDWATVKQNAIQRTNRNLRAKNKNFIELTNFEKLQSEKNIALDHKIDKMRNGKIQPNEKETKRLYFSSNKEMSQNKDIVSHNHHLKLSMKRIKRNGSNYTPIGYSGQRLQKKVSKIPDMVKYNAHFIDMEISIDPGVVLMGSDGKQNSSKKENLKFNIFQKTREKKCNQILNSKNIYHAVFRAPPKKISDEEKKFEFERKFQNFVNNFEKCKVQLTFRQLMQFKEIVYRKRQEEYFLAQQEVCHHQKSLKVITEQSIDKHVASSKNNVVKKQEVNIQNLKNYEDMISAGQPHQDFGKITTKKPEKKITKAQGNFSYERPQSRKDTKSSLSFHVRNPSKKQMICEKDGLVEQ